MDWWNSATHRWHPRCAAQHLNSLACGPGLDPETGYASIRRAAAYADLSRDDWNWCLKFLEHGGEGQAIPLPQAGVGCDSERLRVRENAIARLHRLNIGTIPPRRRSRCASCGGCLGHVEETFIGQLKPKDVFFFSGRQLEFVRLRDMTAYVKLSTRKSRMVPAWAGGQMALSDLLTHHLRREVDRASRRELDTPELKALEPLFARQQDLSVLPRIDQLLIETCNTREGTHLYAYPFEGRFVHEGIGFLWASRLTQLERGTITVSVNDYG